MSKELTIVRTDHADGSQELVEKSRAVKAIGQDYINVEVVLRRLAKGYPVRCSFATYQRLETE